MKRKTEEIEEPESTWLKAEEQTRTCLPVNDELIIGTIIDFLDTRNWIQLSYTCKTINAFKKTKQHMIHKKRSVRYVASTDRQKVAGLLESFELAEGTLFNVSFNNIGYAVVTDKWFPPLAKTIHTLGMEHCRLVTDKAFQHLMGIHTLDMKFCFQQGITDAALLHLKGIHTLNIRSCDQLTGSTWDCLNSLRILEASGCDRVPHDAFNHLTHIKKLNVSHCDCLNAHAIRNLSTLKQLNIVGCSITDESLASFPNLEILNLYNIGPNNTSCITGSAFQHLPKLHTLQIKYCINFDCDNLRYLTAIRTLVLHEVSNLTDEHLKHLSHVRHLDISGCYQITGEGFQYLTSTRTLDITWCMEVTANSFRYLSNVHNLRISREDESDFDVEAAVPFLHSIRVLDMGNRFESSVVERVSELLGKECEVRANSGFHPAFELLHRYEGLQ